MIIQPPLRHVALHACGVQGTHLSLCSAHSALHRHLLPPSSASSPAPLDLRSSDLLPARKVAAAAADAAVYDRDK